jgi:hypothetical protein
MKLTLSDPIESNTQLIITIGNFTNPNSGAPTTPFTVELFDSQGYGLA